MDKLEFGDLREEPAKIKGEVLDIIRVRLDHWKSEQELLADNNLDLFNARVERMGEILIGEIEGYLAGEQHETSYSEHVPESWWDHFKDAYFSGWLRRKFPPKYREILCTRSETYVFPKVEIPSEAVEKINRTQR